MTMMIRMQTAGTQLSVGALIICDHETLMILKMMARMTAMMIMMTNTIKTQVVMTITMKTSWFGVRQTEGQLHQQ